MLEKYKEYDVYDNTENGPNLQNYMELQTKNVKWLLEMPNKEWESILDECKEIAEYNYKIITNVLYEETIRELIKEIDKIEVNLKNNII